LNVYTLDECFLNENIEYSGTIIQLQIEPIPQLQKILNNPWDFRFLQESRVVYDPEDTLYNLKKEAVGFFKSKIGKAFMKKQWREVVNSRISWVESSMKREEWITAGIAAKSAWIDAGLGYQYFTNASLSTGKLLSVMRELSTNDNIRSIVFGYESLNNHDSMSIIKNYRSCLLQAYGKHFQLDHIQDELISRKIERHKRNIDYENIIFHAYGEIFGCILVTEESFEKHLKSLSMEHKEGLRLLGFRKYDEQEIIVICKQAEVLKNMVG
jgi:hypothetical protein